MVDQTIGYYLLTSVLQVAHKRLLDAIELGKLDADCLAGALQVLSALRQILPAFNPGRRHSEGAL